MAKFVASSIALLVALNILFFTMVSSTSVPCPPPPHPKSHPTPYTPNAKPIPTPYTPSPKPHPTPNIPNPTPHPKPSPNTPHPKPTPYTPSPKTYPTPNTPSPTPNPKPSPTPNTPHPKPTPTPYTPTPSTPSSYGKCPKDTLKLKVCANLLNDLVHLVIGSSLAKTECCSLIQGLADLDAAVCLCTAIKANVLGINLNVPLSLNLLLNNCGKYCPDNFQCA